MADGSNLTPRTAANGQALASDGNPMFPIPVEITWNSRGNICEASSRPLPVQYARLEDDPAFQREKAAREYADRMISADFADVIENGGWFGGDYYRPGGEIDHDEGRRQHREMIRKAADDRAAQTAHSNAGRVP